MFKKFLFALMCLFVATPVFATSNILVLGDSLSAGYGIDTQLGWVALLRDRLQKSGYNYHVVNASISGDTTSGGVARLPGALENYKPVIIIIELGGNDALRGIPINETQQNLEQLIVMSQKIKAKVILLGLRLPPNFGPVYNKYFQHDFTDLAKKYKIAVVPLFLNGVDANPKLMQDDGIHPRAEAQLILLNNVWPVLKPLLGDNT
jgi:acyl-CoA thioesterase-1